MMDAQFEQRKAQILYGLAVVFAVHHGFHILGKLLEHAIVYLIDYQYTPWFYLGMLLIEIRVLWHFFEKKAGMLEISLSRFTEMAALATILYLIASLDHYYEYQYKFWCGNALMDGMLEPVYEKLAMQVERVYPLKVISVGIFLIFTTLKSFAAMRETEKGTDLS